jgi:DNA polymerase-3 subunit gamma/tau
VGAGNISAADVNNLLGIAPAERLSGLVRALADRDAPAALAELDSAIASGVEVGLLLDQLVGYFRDVMAMSVGCKPEQLLYALPSQSGEVSEIGRRLGIATVLAIGQILDQASARMRVSVHGRTLVEMAVVRICQLGELDELATLIAELRGTAADGPAGAPVSAPSQAGMVSKKNVEPEAPSLAQGFAKAVSSVLAPSPPRISSPSAQVKVETPVEPRPQMMSSPASSVPSPRTNGESKAVTEVAVNDLLAESAESLGNGAPAGESVLAQFQRAVKAGGVPRSEASAPRKSQREQMAEVAEQPFVKRAMEMFDVGPGQFRYTPPEGEST